MSGIFGSLKRALATVLTFSFIVAPLPMPRPASATTSFLSDTASHPPPTTGSYAYYNTYGSFGPDQPGFPGKGQSFVDPVFGNTITRLTNEVGTHSWSEIYAKNGFINADNTLVHHRTPAGRYFLNTTTGAIVRSNVPGNFDSSFAPDNPDIWYWFTAGTNTLYKYSVSANSSTAVKTFSQPLGGLGASVDWIDRTGQYMLVHLGSGWQIYDVKNDILYSGSIPDTYGGDPGWAGISPDGLWVITTNDSGGNTASGAPWAHRSWAINHTTKSVSTTGTIFWTLCGDHGDIVSASNGKTYFVVFECYNEMAIYAADVSLDQSKATGDQERASNKRLVKLASWNDSGHFSCVTKGALSDWCYVDIEDGDDTFGSTVTSWRFDEQEIMMMNVVTGELRRLAHHRSRSPQADYYYTPRISVSFDGSLVTWVSNFGYAGTGYADLYQMRVDTGTTSGGTGGTGGGGTGGGTSSPTVAFTNPASGSTVSGTQTVSLNAGGGSGSGYSFAVKIGTNTIYTGTNPSFSWNTTTVANGSTTLSATVTDSAGGTGSASDTVMVSNSTSGGGTGGTVSPGNVVWTSLVNATASGNTVTKSGGCSGCWDAGASSQQSIASGDGYVQFQVSSNAWPTVGLSAPGSGTSGDAVAFGLRFFPGTPYYVEVRESGVWKSSWNVAVGDTHKVAIEGGVVKYYQNGTLRYTSATAPGYPLVADASLAISGESVQNAIIGTAGSSTGTGGTTGDTTKPTVSLTAPASGATVSGNVAVSANASDNVGVVGVQFKLDGVNLGAEVTTAPYSVSWNTANATNASHTLSAVARDAAGNTTTSAGVTVTVNNVVTPPADTTPPTVSLTAPATGTITGTVSVSATASDNVGVVGVQFKLDGANLGAESTAPPYSVSWDTTSATNTGHTLTAVARDAAGNTTTSAPLAVTVSNVTLPPPGGTVTDTTPPTVTISSPANNASIGNKTTITASASDNTSVRDITLYGDGGSIGTISCSGTTCSGNVQWNTAPLKRGPHTIRADARDTAGNISSTTITVTK